MSLFGTRRAGVFRIPGMSRQSGVVFRVAGHQKDLDSQNRGVYGTGRPGLAPFTKIEIVVVVVVVCDCCPSYCSMSDCCHF